MQLPTREQCLEYFNKYKVPHNIKEHCLKVEEVATFLAKKLKQAGEEINVELISRAALLHDLFKPATFKDPHNDPYVRLTEEQIKVIFGLKAKYPGKYENQIAYDLFKDQYPELALLIKNAGYDNLIERTIAEIIVHYADYRVSHKTGLVSLAERFAYLRKAYKDAHEDWDEYFAHTQKEEKRLFDKLDFEPEQLKEKLPENVR